MTPAPDSTSLGHGTVPSYEVWVTPALLALIVFIYGVQVWGTTLGQDAVLEWGIKWNDRIAEGEWWRLVTPIFLHLDIWHIAFNGFVLYQVGRQVEMFYGPARFLALFFLAGVAGCLASLWFAPYRSAGASGAIFGLVGAEIVLFYRNRQWLGQAGSDGLRNALMLAGINLLIGLSGRVDNWGHVGGLVGGLVVAWLIGPLWALPAGRPLGRRTVLPDQQPLTPARWLILFGLALGLAGSAVAYMVLY